MNVKGGIPPNPIKPGETRNPGGRTSSKWLRELLAASQDKTPNGPSRREAIALHQIEIATRTGRGADASPKESTAAAEAIWAYDMGKPVEAVELTGQEGGPIQTESVGMLAQLTPEAKIRYARSLIENARKANGQPERP